MTSRQHELARKIEAQAERIVAAGVLTVDEAADAVEFLKRAPDPTPWFGLGPRNKAIRRYYETYCSGDGSQAARIRQLLHDLRIYAAGEWRLHQRSGSRPSDVDDRRALLFMIMATGPKPPNSEEGLRKILV